MSCHHKFLTANKSERAVKQPPQDVITVLFLIVGYSRITVKEMFNKFDETNQKKMMKNCAKDKLQDSKAKGRISGLFVTHDRC
ncbi:ABC transporter ATP-binding protein [Rahnella aquatilis]|nr:ABC transporter ATP-binding protein [Rahnella aquatilis]